MIEPKFKKGDIITDNCDGLWEIHNIIFGVNGKYVQLTLKPFPCAENREDRKEQP